MKAIRFLGANQPLQMMDVPEPKPGDGEVVVAINACGLCHSDIHLLEGSLPAPVPLTLGHEIAGTVVEHGPGVTQPAIGSKVAVYLVNPSGDTLFDRIGRENLVESPQVPGLTIDGGMAEHVIVRARNLVFIPEGVTMSQAAVATDSVATTYHAIKTIAKVRAGEKLGIIGLGGLGLNGVQIGLISGAMVFACDRNSLKTDLARQMGATAIYANADELAQHPLDCIIDFVGVSATLNAAINAVQSGGRIVVVGLGAHPVELPFSQIVTREISVTGAFGSTYKELIEVLDFIAAKRIIPHVTEIDFADVITGYQRLARGEVQGRLVAKI